VQDRRVWVTALLAAGAVALFALHQHVVDVAALAQHGVFIALDGRPMGPSFYLSIPYRVIDPEFGPPQSAHAALLVLALAECALLFALYRSLRDRAVAPSERVALGVAALAITALAMSARSVFGFDLYAYAGLAKLGLAGAYAPPAVPFAGEFAAINRAWGLPMAPTPYGPLWVAVAHALAGGARSLASALLLLRVLALVPFVAIAAILLRRGIVFAALFALDPSMQNLFVVNGHNDLAGVVLVLLALLVVAATPLGALLLTTAAGLVKVHLTGCALLVFAGRAPLARRAAWVVSAFVLVAADSVLLGGPNYIHEWFVLLRGNHAQHGIGSVTGNALRTILFFVAVAAALIAFLRQRIWRSGSWAFVALTSTVYPWYLASALPYASLERGALAAFLIGFPVVAGMLEFAFPHLGLGQVAMLGILIACAVQLARRDFKPIDEPALRPASS